MSQIEFSAAQVEEAAKALVARLQSPEPEELFPDSFAPNSAHGTAVPQETGDEQNYDKTQLSMLAGMNLVRIHRDYLAHAIRYEFLISRIKALGEKAMVLDIGCADVPLMRAMRSSMLRPKFYLGLDVRPRLIDKVNDYYSTHKVHFPFSAQYMDFTEAKPELLHMDWTHVVCLEVLEHMPRGRGEKLLQNVLESLKQGGTGYLSTPCFDGQRKARHHKYEWQRAELEDALIKTGFNIQNCWGTFGSVHELKRHLTPEEKIVWDNLSQSKGGYYGSIALSLIFSPLHPEAARNCIWELTAL